MAKRRRRKSQTKNISQGQPLALPTKSAATTKVLVLLGLTLVAYALTLNVPFYLDDFTSIRENPAIRDIGNFEAVFNFSPARFVSYLSFALNFSLHEYQLTGYHIVNILIHLSGVFLVFVLSQELHSLQPKQAEEIRYWAYFPLLAAALFALHPLQIQAVTYIVQRSASLAALFYLLSIYAYLKARTTTVKNTRVLLFAFVPVAGFLAIFTKQHTVTLPLALVLIELIFFKHSRQVLVKLFGVCAVCGLTIALLLYLVAGAQFFTSLSEATQETDLVTRGQYLAVQMGVLWSYIYKFLIPYPLHLEYDVAVTDFSNFTVQLFALMHILVIGWAIWAIRKYPIVAFGILFYYTAHLVESSIIPIRDFAFEHRTYLPNFGLCLAAAWIMLSALPKVMPQKHVLAVCSVIVLTAMGLTIQRNLVWADPIAFYRHETRVNPELLRPWSILGETYLRENRNEEAVEAYRQGEQFYGQSFDRQNNTQVAFYQNYVLALDRIQAWDEAMEVLSRINFDVLDPPNLSRFLFLRGNILANQERLNEAEPDLRRAIELNPANFDARLSYGKLLFVSGNLIPARQTFTELLEMDAQHYSADEARTLIQTIDAYLAQQPELQAPNQ